MDNGLEEINYRMETVWTIFAYFCDVFCTCVIYRECMVLVGVQNVWIYKWIMDQEGEAESTVR